jgi:uncharacterized alkaline shock family protein YloU
VKLLSRFIIVFFTFLVTAVSLLLLAQVFHIVSPEQIGLPLWLTEKFLLFTESDWQIQLIFGVICFGVFLTGVVLLYIELRPFFASELCFLVSKNELGKLEINESCIGKFINYEAMLFDEITGATSQIINKNSELHIKSYIVIKPETEIKELEQNLQIKLKDKLESNFGLLVSSISIINKKTERSKRI